MNMKKKRILSLLLLATVLFTTVGNPTVARATEATEGQLNVADYKGENATQPYPTQEGKVFAGWYTDSAYTNPLGEEVKSGYAYAKFVDEDVLSIKFQLTAGVNADSQNTNLRMLTTVDSLNYRSVGFIIELYGKTITRTATTVYQTISGYVDGEGENYRATVFSKASQYFMAYAIEGIPNCDFATQIKIIPIWTTLDGTIVQGLDKAFAVEDTFTDFERGVNFEYQSHDASFGGYLMSIERVKYADTGLGKQGEEYGNYGLKGTGITSNWPYLQILFGRPFTKGSTLTYKMYVDTGATKPEKTGKIERDDKNASLYSVVTGTMQANTWMDVEVTINAETYRVDLMLNVEELVKAGVNFADITIYFDNFKVHTYNIGEGAGFEQPCDKNFIASSNNTKMPCEIKAYKDTAIGNQNAEFGNYGLVGTVNEAFPGLTVNFNNTYKTGETLHFKAYVEAPSQYEGKQWKLETPTNGTLPTWMFAFNEWVDVEIKLTADSTSMNLTLNFASGVTGVPYTTPGTAKVYLDNFKISSFDISKGAGFEQPFDKNFIASSDNNKMTSAIVAYKDTEIGNQIAEFGNYGQVHTVKNAWPTMKVNFNGTYGAGKALHFKAYVAAPSQYEGKQWKLETPANCTLPTWMFAFNTWVDVKIDLQANLTSANLMLNFAQGVTEVPFESGAIKVYVDNFVIK